MSQVESMLKSIGAFIRTAGNRNPLSDGGLTELAHRARAGSGGSAENGAECNDLAHAHCSPEARLTPGLCSYTDQ